MENRELAQIFTEMADILEIKDDNPFRIRSFRRVAQILESLSFGVASALAQEPDRVRAIPGIGEGTVKKISEIVTTGRCQEHQKLKAEVPESLLDLLHLQSLGPKKIALFWKELNITTLDELESAARAQRLRALPGMGEKSESKILKAIDDYRRSLGRFRLDEGMEVSQSVINHVRSRASITRATAAGSLRRRRETVGDLDILVTSETPTEAVQAFTSYPGVKEVLASGETKASVVLGKGLQVDLRVLDDHSFGSALQYFTGSKAHNVALRERAKRMGFKISEYGLFRLADEAKVAGENEEDIYRLLGLDFIPPELRENRGEIEDAEAGRLPRLIELRDIRGDLHIHTVASDGRETIEDMAVAGQEYGYDYIAITEHSKALAMTGGLNEDELLQQIEQIDRISPRLPGIAILKGIEVDILGDGSLDLSDDVLSRLDVVIASVHSRFNMTGEEMTARVCRALENPWVNILSHPTGRLLTRREPYALRIEEVIRAACANRILLEVNAYPARLDLNDVHCRMARDMGALLVINTDSHDRGMLGYMDYGVATARRGWLEAEDVANTYPLEQLRQILKKTAYR